MSGVSFPLIRLISAAPQTQFSEDVKYAATWKNSVPAYYVSKNIYFLLSPQEIYNIVSQC